MQNVSGKTSEVIDKVNIKNAHGIIKYVAET